MEQKPSIGRIVHYQAYGTPGGEHKSQPRAAVITAVKELFNDGTISEAVPHGMPIVSLCVLNPTGQFFNQDVPFSEAPKAGHWNWPPRT